MSPMGLFFVAVAAGGVYVGLTMPGISNLWPIGVALALGAAWFNFQGDARAARVARRAGKGKQDSAEAWLGAAILIAFGVLILWFQNGGPK